MSLFSPSTVKYYETPSDTSAEEAAMEEARRKEEEAARKAKGRKATILTGGMGVMGEAPVYKRLLGE